MKNILFFAYISLMSFNFLSAHENKSFQFAQSLSEELPDIPEFKSEEESMIWFGIGCPDKSNFFPENFTSKEKEEYIENALDDLKKRKNLSLLLVAYYFEKDQDSKALYWALKGAENGNGTCMSILRAAYASGNGVIQDFEETFKWCFLAAAKGIECDKKMLHDFIKSYKNVKNISTIIENGRIKAKEWMKKFPEAFFDPT